MWVLVVIIVLLDFAPNSLLFLFQIPLLYMLGDFNFKQILIRLKFKNFMTYDIFVGRFYTPPKGVKGQTYAMLQMSLRGHKRIRK